MSAFTPMSNARANPLASFVRMVLFIFSMNAFLQKEIYFSKNWGDFICENVIAFNCKMLPQLIKQKNTITPFRIGFKGN